MEEGWASFGGEQICVYEVARKIMRIVQEKGMK